MGGVLFKEGYRTVETWNTKLTKKRAFSCGKLKVDSFVSVVDLAELWINVSSNILSYLSHNLSTFLCLFLLCKGCIKNRKTVYVVYSEIMLFFDDSYWKLIMEVMYLWKSASLSNFHGSTARCPEKSKHKFCVGNHPKWFYWSSLYLLCSINILATNIFCEFKLILCTSETRFKCCLRKGCEHPCGNYETLIVSKLI